MHDAVEQGHLVRSSMVGVPTELGDDPTVRDVYRRFCADAGELEAVIAEERMERAAQPREKPEMPPPPVERRLVKILEHRKRGKELYTTR